MTAALVRPEVRESIDAEHARLLAEFDATVEQIRKLGDKRDDLALALLELEGRGHIPAAEWLRAHKARDFATTTRIRDENPDSYFNDSPLRVLPDPNRCACGHYHSAGSDGEDGGCRDGDCKCMEWRSGTPAVLP